MHVYSQVFMIINIYCHNDTNTDNKSPVAFMAFYNHIMTSPHYQGPLYGDNFNPQ